MATLKRTQHHTVDILFVLSLFVVFAATAIALVLIGIQVFRTTVNGMSDNTQARVTTSYLTEKMHQGDLAGSVSIVSIGDGVQALCLEETHEEQAYETYIYVYDGNLKELLITKGSTLLPESGQDIAKVSSLTMEQVSSHLFSFVITNVDGSTDSLYLTTRSAQDESFTLSPGSSLM